MQSEQGPKRKSGLSRLIELAGTKRKYLTAAGISCAVGSIAKMAVYLFIYLIIKQLVDSNGVVASIPDSVIFGYAGGAALALLCFLVFKSAGSICSHIAAFNILYEIRMELSRKLARLPLGYFSEHASGSVKKVMSEDVERIEHFVAHNIVDFVSGVVTPLVTVVFMFAVDWRMALAAIISIPIALIAGRNMFGGTKTQELSDQYQMAMGKMNGSAVEYVKGMPVIKTFSEGKTVYASLKNDIENSRSTAVVWAKGIKTPYILFNVLISASILFIFPVGTFLLSNAISYQTLLIAVLFFFVIGTNFAEPMKQLMLLTGEMRKITFGMECIDDILTQAEINEPAQSVQENDTSIEFRNVSFSYDSEEVLGDVSFRCRPGSVTALVGPSGAGKSTIAQLIARFWDVQKGEILIGGHNIKEYSNEKLMEMVSFVFQDVVMLSDTIEENIRMGNQEASLEDVQAAAKAAQIHDYIMLLPNGYQTKIGESGIHLSGGEQQRISIARVFLKNTPIVLLDEATSYADAENEGLIQQAFSALSAEKTVVIVAHRLSTIASAEQILVIDKGQIVENGTQADLIGKAGLYAAMWKAMTASEGWNLTTKGVAQ